MNVHVFGLHVLLFILSFSIHTSSSSPFLFFVFFSFFCFLSFFFFFCRYHVVTLHGLAVEQPGVLEDETARGLKARGVVVRRQQAQVGLCVLHHLLRLCEHSEQMSNKSSASVRHRPGQMISNRKVQCCGSCARALLHLVCSSLSAH